MNKRDNCNKKFDEFVRHECSWIGSSYNGKVCKNDLIKLCDKLEIEYKNSDTKVHLYEKISKKISNYKIYLKLRDEALGIPSHIYEERFGVTRNQRKKMIDTGFIKVRYYVSTKVFPRKYADVPYVDAHQFYFMTQEKIDRWRMENIRGFKKQEKME